MKQPATRRFYDSWRLLTYTCIILCIFLGPRKRLFTYTYIILCIFLGPRKRLFTYICIILCIFLGPRKRLYIFASFYVSFWDPGKKCHGNHKYRTEVEEYEGTVIYRTLLFYNSVFLGRYEKKSVLTCFYFYFRHSTILVCSIIEFSTIFPTFTGSVL